ncbi:MAG: 23S rRNA (adenine(2503)-C(2))-methyltransferase RlmN [Rhodospirillaceae bacterium]|nr:23S rRNA (adenine(2503)-C(2))-methyltransferase RlmN [Rhodospirillaceae bacterium]
MNVTPAISLAIPLADPAAASTPKAGAAQAARPALVGLSKPELIETMAGLGEKPFRAKQIWHWMYHQGAKSFAEMTDLSKDFRAKLEDHFTVGRPDVAREQTSTDGTRKWLMNFSDGQKAETVFIPDDDRGAVCISSQVGCTLTCRFCHTGTQRLVRNLTSAEIVGQFMVARDSYGEWPTPNDQRRLLSNIVMMGMGEPLYNFDNVAKALKIIMADDGIALGKRRITLSTSGVVPEIRRCGAELGVNLAISLHAPDDDTRSAIMPINKKYPVKELIQACRDYPGLNNARRITFEYVMLKGMNDTAQHAKALVKLISGIPSKFNLIPFNPWPGSLYECSDPATVRAFSDILNNAGYTATVRTPRGRDILAACGQLRTDSERLSAKEQRLRDEQERKIAEAAWQEKEAAI